MRKDIYVVGYKPANNSVYGKERLDRNCPGYSGHASPMTAFQAKRLLKTMPSKGAVIYKLVEVKEP